MDELDKIFSSIIDEKKMGEYQNLLDEALLPTGMAGIFNVIGSDKNGYIAISASEIDKNNIVKSILAIKDDIIDRFCRSSVFYDLCEQYRVKRIAEEKDKL